MTDVSSDESFDIFRLYGFFSSLSEDEIRLQQAAEGAGHGLPKQDLLGIQPAKVQPEH